MSHIYVVTKNWNCDTQGAFTTLDAAKRWVAGQYEQWGYDLAKPNPALDTDYTTAGEELEDTWGIAEFMYIEEVALMDMQQLENFQRDIKFLQPTKKKLT